MGEYSTLKRRVPSLGLRMISIPFRMATPSRQNETPWSEGDAQMATPESTWSFKPCSSSPVWERGIQDWHNSCGDSCAAHTDRCRVIVQPKLEVDSSLYITDGSHVGMQARQNNDTICLTITVTLRLSKGFLPSILMSSLRACQAQIRV